MNDENTIKWYTIENDGIPKENRYVLFIGKGGKTGYGITRKTTWQEEYSLESGLIDTIMGANNLIFLDSVYAYAYIDIPDYIWKNLPNQKQFAKSRLANHLKEKGLIND